MGLVVSKTELIRFVDGFEHEWENSKISRSMASVPRRMDFPWGRLFRYGSG